MAEKTDGALVEKSDKAMFFLKAGIIHAEYSISFGANPTEHKQKIGDERLPEGRYILEFKRDDSAFYKAIDNSYRSDTDRHSAGERGVDAGGDIIIHDQRNWLGWLSFITQKCNWTYERIAAANRDMHEIWDIVPVNTGLRCANDLSAMSAFRTCPGLVDTLKCAR